MSSLPDTFDMADVNEYLSHRLSISNRNACMNVIFKLTSGVGIEHKNKPGGQFMKGIPVKPKDDLEDLKKKAEEWLPSKKGPDCLDKGHGWALNHPIKKLMEYKNHLLGIEPIEPKRTKRKRENVMDTISHLKELLDKGAITNEEFDAKKTDLLARV